MALSKSTSNKKTLVIGASANPSRYSYLAINRLLEQGHEVVLVGNKAGEVHGKPIRTNLNSISNIDTVTLYLNKRFQATYEEQILELNPRRIIFNPGAENSDFRKAALERGIEAINACNLVMLSIGTY